MDKKFKESLKEYKKRLAVIDKKMGDAIKDGDKAALQAVIEEQLAEMRKQLRLQR